MDINATIHIPSNQFQTSRYLSIFALTLSTLALAMSSGITVIFRKNFGFLISPLKVPVERVATAIARHALAKETSEESQNPQGIQMSSILQQNPDTIIPETATGEEIIENQLDHQ